MTGFSEKFTPMIEKIKENANNPEELEKLYRIDRNGFESAFEKVYPEIENSLLVSFWKIRLDSDKEPDLLPRLFMTDIMIMIAACLLTAFLIKIPLIFKIRLTEFIFYEKNAGIIVFLGLSLYAAWINRISEKKKLIISFLLFLIPLIYINLLPSVCDSSSVNLAYIHLPLLMWCIYGLVFIDFTFQDNKRRLEYIRYNGDLAIMLALILIAGGILTGITIGLFSAIRINIEIFYKDYIMISGLVSAPIVATFIIKNYNTFTNKIAPIIANIFSPIVLITLVIYLIAIPVSGKDPYNDRDFLLIFNIMLLGVMAIILFSVSESSMKRKQRFNEIIVFILTIVSVIIDLIALSAIFYRLGEFGISPNRLAVLGSNILISGNLILILIDLYKVNFRKSEIEKVGLTISKYLPVYLVWILIVVFGFPIIFGMK
jgi:hypothetical protein